ncbi:MAG: GreA/GreB family elongation factor [Mycobacteriales bacterium]
MSVLSEETRARLRAELAALRVERARLLELAANTEGKDPADQAERTMREFDIEQVDRRIARFRERLDHAERADRNAAFAVHDGSVREGEVVVLDFGDGVEERYVVGALLDVDDDVLAVTPASPLGKALLGATAGTSVSYRMPGGERSVRVVSVGEAEAALAS